MGIDPAIFDPVEQGSFDAAYARESIAPNDTVTFEYSQPVTIKVSIKGTGTTLSGKQRTLEGKISFTFVPSLLPSGSPVYVSTIKWGSQ